MANDTATLRGYLATQLRDTAFATWTSAEMTNLIDWALNSLWPRYSRALDPTTTTVTTVANTYYYSLPTGVRAVSRIDRVSGTEDFGPVSGRSWELVGDVMNGSGKLHVGPIFNATDVLRLHGYGVYDGATNLIPDYFIPLVLAKARAEAYRRMSGDRAQFKAWLSRNQVQNMSVNELILMINEADAEAQQLEARIAKTWQRPVSGRVG